MPAQRVATVAGLNLGDDLGCLGRIGQGHLECVHFRLVWVAYAAKTIDEVVFGNVGSLVEIRKILAIDAD